MTRKARMIVALLSVTGAASVIVACSFELADVAPADGNEGGVADAAPADDGGLGIDVPVSPPSACSDPSCFALPAGWTPIAFGFGAKGATCPGAFAGRGTDVVEGPVSTANACTCGSCAVTTVPTCDKGTLAFDYGSGGLGCPTSMSPLVVDGGGCTNLASFITIDGNTSMKFARPTPTGGACSMTDAGAAITYASEDRVCASDGTGIVECSDGRACAPATTTPFAVCIGKDGAEECPAGSFSEKHVVGGSASASCASPCVCTTSAACNAQFTFHKVNQCNGGSVTAVADGVCHPIGAGGTNDYHSYAFSAVATAVACAVDGGGGGATVTVTSPLTICCTPK